MEDLTIDRVLATVQVIKEQVSRDSNFVESLAITALTIEDLGQMPYFIFRSV